MKEGMSSVDIKYVVDELQGLLGSRVEKVYHNGSEIRIKLHTKEGRRDLILEAGKRLHVTTYIKEAPRTPSAFTMLLRKYLNGAFVDSIEQHDFDRIVRIRMGDYTLIGELFRRGNVILVDSSDTIVAALRYEEYKDRVIKPKNQYRYPPARENPLRIEWEHFLRLMRMENLEIIRALARNLNIGGMYAEEITLRAGVDKLTPTDSLSDEELRRIFEEMKGLFSEEPKPNVVYKDGSMHDVVPINLLYYRNMEKRWFATFSEALDEYFGRLTMEKLKAEKTRKLNEMKKGLLATLRRQEDMMKGFEEQEKVNRDIGNRIYENFLLIESLLSELKEAVEKLGWEEVRRRLEEGAKKGNRMALMIKALDPSRKLVVIELEGKKVTLDLRKSVGENAEVYYKKAKRARHKLEGARVAYEKTKKKLADVERIIEQEMKKGLAIRRIERRKRRWFEKFRWFVSSEGFMVLAGRDAGTNEVLVKRYMEKEDLYCHADVYGAPHVVIKKGAQAGENTVREACQFAVSMSRAWSQGLYSADAYWVRPEQVTKQAPSGEYLRKGAFMVYGKRNWVRGLPLELAVGIMECEGDEYVVCAPVSALSAHTDRYVVVVPGRLRKSELVRRIRKVLREWGYAVGEEEVTAVLPPGGGEIKEIRTV